MQPYLIAAIAAFAPCMAVILGFIHTRKKVEEIHVLVNARLDEALNEIETLKSRYE